MGPGASRLCLLLLLLRALAEPTENSDFYLAGDFLLGGLFSLHANMKGTSHVDILQVPTCKKFSMKVLGYNLMQAMRFAVEEINNHSSLLPGVQLGYEIVDICYMFNNIQPVLYLMAREDYLLPILKDYSNYVPRVVAIIGPDNSESTRTVANFLSALLLPQVTYSAISDRLRDKAHFPATLRSVPSASHHVEAMVQLMLHFHWNWIVVLLSNDDYGLENSQLLRQRLLNGSDICIAFQEVLPAPAPAPAPARLDAILDKLRRSTARVVVVFSPELALHQFFLAVLRWNLTGAVWIASESWAIDPELHKLSGLSHTGTFLGVTVQRVPVPGFSEFRLRLAGPRPPARPEPRQRGTCNQECDTCHGETASYGEVLSLSGERVVFCVYAAVYAVAHALHRLLGCNQTSCARGPVHPWQLLRELWDVNFTLLNNEIFFDPHGDMTLHLDIVQWRWDLSENPFKSVAFYSPRRQRLEHISNITWHTGDNSVPVSMCSKSCRLGQMKKAIGLHPCCFECLDCLPGTFYNQTKDEFDCQPCPSAMWSHRNDVSCFRRRLAFLAWPDAAAIVVTVLAGLGFLSTLAVLALFWRHFRTPTVRSAGGPMCFVMLAPLLLAFGMAPIYVGPPTTLTCLWRQAFFTLCFTVCISCVAVRSFQIVCIFQMASRLPRAYGLWVRYRGPYVFVALMTAVKAAIVAGNMLASPTVHPTGRPDPEDPSTTIVSCTPNYRLGLLLNTSMDMLLSVVGFSFAYMGKALPTSYNEAKFITLCMTFSFTSSVSLCTFMAVHDGVLVTVMDLLVTVLNFLALGLGYFGPKCYLILFYPERNTPAYFNSMIQGYTMGKD
ncbi:LOW QUALITY PROTEIN: taste receptor type 1 member 2 [Perognathus longimembris pacificus]|uniref:LOW QUALITY PROTEIN: taste receptor type 1 member 2 n=1 Tax=Perognathus longimembris pacificus TaxID=214514 RepID=UPI00201980D2|nr:LOW QUALITY PROTEIN: taste receptor type 1 member 2 [Perognathus longimembris pacificus]